MNWASNQHSDHQPWEAERGADQYKQQNLASTLLTGIEIMKKEDQQGEECYVKNKVWAWASIMKMKTFY